MRGGAGGRRRRRRPEPGGDPRRSVCCSGSGGRPRGDGGSGAGAARRPAAGPRPGLREGTARCVPPPRTAPPRPPAASPRRWPPSPSAGRAASPVTRGPAGRAVPPRGLYLPLTPPGSGAGGDRHRPPPGVLRAAPLRPGSPGASRAAAAAVWPAGRAASSAAALAGLCGSYPGRGAMPPPPAWPRGGGAALPFLQRLFLTALLPRAPVPFAAVGCSPSASGQPDRGGNTSARLRCLAGSSESGSPPSDAGRGIRWGRVRHRAPRATQLLHPICSPEGRALGADATLCAEDRPQLPGRWALLRGLHLPAVRARSPVLGQSWLRGAGCCPCCKKLFSAAALCN